MKLFMLRTTKQGKPVQDANGNILYFSNKMLAKDFRDKIGGTTVVSYGPDHKLYVK